MRNTHTSAMAIGGTNMLRAGRGVQRRVTRHRVRRCRVRRCWVRRCRVWHRTPSFTTHSTGGSSMAQAGINVGPFDARARQVAGALAIIGGLTALDGFFQALGFLTWIVCAAMMYVGILYAMGGFKDGTAVFGYPLLALSVLDAWLPLVHKGYWGLIAGLFVAVGAFQTARTRVCPINGLLGVNTAAASSA